MAESLSEAYPVLLKRIGINDRFGESGPYKDLLNKYQLTAKYIYEAALDLLDRKRKKNTSQ